MCPECWKVRLVQAPRMLRGSGLPGLAGPALVRGRLNRLKDSQATPGSVAGAKAGNDLPVSPNPAPRNGPGILVPWLPCG